MSLFIQEDNVAVELTFKKLFLKLWPFLARHKPRIAISLVLVITYAGVGRALPFIFGKAVDLGIRSQNVKIIGYLTIAYLLVESLRIILVFGQSAYIQNFGNLVLFEIREKLVRHIQ